MKPFMNLRLSGLLIIVAIASAIRPSLNMEASVSASSSVSDFCAERRTPGGVTGDCFPGTRGREADMSEPNYIYTYMYVFVFLLFYVCKGVPSPWLVG
jgi:hypothetical protein